MIYLAFATIGFVINWLFFRKRKIEYAIIASLVYLLAFVFVKSFDILYVEYVAFFILPHFKDFRRIPVIYFIFCIYIFIELIIGIIHEPVNSVFAVFLTRFFPIIFISLINKNGSIISRRSNDYEQKLLRMIVVCELIISTVLVFKGDPGEIFVVSHQPVGANLSLAGVFLAMDIALKSGSERGKHRIENILYLLLFAAFALISGIRGYIIIIIPCVFYAIISYVFVKPSRRRIGLFLTIVLAISILSISYLTSGRLASIIASIDTSVGYRAIENEFFFQTMKNANPLRWLCGYGIGSRGERIGSGSTINALARGSKYYTRHLSNGAVFLNYWMTTVKDMGVIGLLLLCVMYLNMIPRRSSVEKGRKTGWVLYVALYAFMLFYRTSCTNGLIEFYLITMIMNNLRSIEPKHIETYQYGSLRKLSEK